MVLSAAPFVEAENCKTDWTWVTVKILARSSPYTMASTLHVTSLKDRHIQGCQNGLQGLSTEYLNCGIPVINGLPIYAHACDVGIECEDWANNLFDSKRVKSLEWWKVEKQYFATNGSAQPGITTALQKPPQDPSDAADTPGSGVRKMIFGEPADDEHGWHATQPEPDPSVRYVEFRAHLKSQISRDGVQYDLKLDAKPRKILRVTGTPARRTEVVTGCCLIVSIWHSLEETLHYFLLLKKITLQETCLALFARVNRQRTCRAIFNSTDFCG